MNKFGSSLKTLSNQLIKQYSTVQRQAIIQGRISPMMTVPESIAYPEYGLTGRPRDTNGVKLFKDPEVVAKIRESARLARKMLDFANSLIEPGITTDEIDKLTFLEIVKHGAYPSPVNYCGFPKAICASVNEVVCHGIPDDRKLVKGDLVSLDVSVFYNGYHGDNCGTVICGGDECGDESSIALRDATKEALEKAISVIGPGKCLSSIGRTIETVAVSRGFRVVHEFCGHGTGPILHMKPLVQHVSNRTTMPLEPGMVFTIEPILVEGSRRITVWQDGWSAVTLDGGRGAQFEHEVLITETGVELLTVPE